MPESSFEDHRYSQHIGLARPYGMSQVKIIGFVLQLWRFYLQYLNCFNGIYRNSLILKNDVS